MKWETSHSARNNAAHLLPRMAAEFFEAGEAAARPEATPQQMHTFRLRTNQFRYTLEIFKPCYDDRIGLLLESLRGLQQHLGEINDSAASADLLLERSDVSPRQRAAIRRSLDRSAALAADTFRAFWDETFRPTVLQEELLQYLAADSA
ncbi:MAG: CHAD domain-containing protein [Bryobacteraceae bacterium]